MASKPDLDYDQVEKTIAALRDENTRLQLERENDRIRITELLNSLKEVSREKSDLEIELAQIRCGHAPIFQRIEALEKSVEKMTEVGRQLARLQSEYSELTRLIDECPVENVIDRQSLIDRQEKVSQEFAKAVSL